MVISPEAKASGRVRWLLVGSLTVNLLLLGAAGAMALQHASTVPLKPVAGINHSMERHLDHIAASLPASDAVVMRTALRADAVKLAAAETELRLSKEAVRESLRAQPFDPAAVRAAMAETNAAREHIYTVVHDAVATATERMSEAGRRTLADWPARRANAVVTQ
jgi:uncharacterized membrane protein